MSDFRDQLRKVCEWNRQLFHDNARLKIEKRGLEIQVGRLEVVNADALAERDAIDAAFGAAMDVALEVRRP